jgi:hypothetical protein
MAKRRERPPPKHVKACGGHSEASQGNLWLTTRQSVHYRLPLDVLAQLDLQAQGENRDKTACVVDALVEYFKRNPVKMGRKR